MNQTQFDLIFDGTPLENVSIFLKNNGTPYLLSTGNIQLKGVKKSVRIKRDQYAVPYIQAETEEDAWFGLGYTQGLDRSFQLEYYKIVLNTKIFAFFNFLTRLYSRFCLVRLIFYLEDLLCLRKLM